MRKRLASLLRTAADQLDPPSVQVIGTATQDAQPGEPVEARLSQPEPTALDLTEENDSRRSEAALEMVDPDVKGWLLFLLRDPGDGHRFTMHFKGFVPKNAYRGFAETLRRVILVLERDAERH